MGSLLTRSTNSPVDAPTPPASLVHLQSSPGIRLVGTYWPAPERGTPAVLLLHGNGSNRGSMTDTATWLNEHGYAVLAIDFRGHGQSSPAGKSFGLLESDDAHAALAWLQRANPDARIGAIGFSLGGAASVLGRRGPLPVDAIVLAGVYPDIRHAIFDRLALRLGRWPAAVVEPLLSYQSVPRLGVWPDSISPIRAVTRVRVPVMIVGGGSDTNTPPSETRAMFDAVKERGELHILAGVSHDELGRILPSDFKRSLLAFLDTNLKEHGPEEP